MTSLLRVEDIAPPPPSVHLPPPPVPLPPPPLPPPDAPHRNLPSEMDETVPTEAGHLTSPYFHAMQHSLHNNRVRWRIASQNIRGMCRKGRQIELSHVMQILKLDIFALQETHAPETVKKQLASGVLLTSSDSEGQREYHGVGIVLSRALSELVDQTILGSSRMCGVSLNTTPLKTLVLSVYAPTAAASEEQKEKFYSELMGILSHFSVHIHLILGDFNVRIGDRPQGHAGIGPNIFPVPYLQANIPPDIEENRAPTPETVRSYNEVLRSSLLEPVTAMACAGMAQTDACSNAFAHQEDTAPATAAEVGNPPINDPMGTDVAVRATERPLLDSAMPVSTTAAIDADGTAAVAVAAQVPYSHLTSMRSIGRNELWPALHTSMIAAAQGQIGVIARKKRKPWVTEPTLALLKLRDEATQAGHHAEARTYTTLFRQHVKIDQRNWQLAMLEHFNGPKQNWDAIRFLRTPIKQTPAKRGQAIITSPLNYPEENAIYLEQRHWRPQSPFYGPSPPPLKLPEGLWPETATSPFTRQELDQAIDGLKKNKSPGPDDIPAELFQYLDNVNREALLGWYNELWEAGKIPEHFNESHIAPILKPGKDPRHYENYRPIALLNTAYKILAKLLLNRIQPIIDPHLVPYQFGYRPNKSSAQPIFIARRAQELAERSGNKFFMAALDYKRAFDSIPKEALQEMLLRYQVPLGIARLIMAIYDTPKFIVKLENKHSSQKTQHIGIRQGCPLSPYLYIMTTSLIFKDLETDLQNTMYSPPTGLLYPALLYADDTLLFATSAPHMNTLLALTIQHSQRLRLELHPQKCKLLVTNDQGDRVVLPSGEEIPKVDQLVYLGAVFHRHLDVMSVLRQRLGQAQSTMKKLQLFWKAAKCPLAWKITIWNSVVRSQLFYALDTLELTLSQQAAIDAKFYQQLRRIMHIPSSAYIARNWTNERLLRVAKARLTQANGAKTAQKLEPFTYYYKKQRTIHLGHLLRAPHHDPVRHVVLEPSQIDRTTLVTKRVGRPRNTWLHSAAVDAWLELHTTTPSPEALLEELAERAYLRIPPFANPHPE